MIQSRDIEININFRDLQTQQKDYSPILTLPDELMSRIFSHLKVNERCQAARTCTFFNRISRDKMLLKESLLKAGQQDFIINTLPQELILKIFSYLDLDGSSQIKDFTPSRSEKFKNTFTNDLELLAERLKQAGFKGDACTNQLISFINWSCYLQVYLPDGVER